MTAPHPTGAGPVEDEDWAPEPEASPLERHYRRVLRVLPAAYRDRWEEDMVATFLESMRGGDPDDAALADLYGRPGLSEVTSVVALAVRLRLGGVEAEPRSYAWGEAVRLVALLGLLAQAVMGTVGLGFTLWLLGLMPWFPAPGDPWPVGTPWGWYAVTMILPLASVGAFLALLYGHRGEARVMAVLMVMLVPVVRTLGGDLQVGLSDVAYLLFDGLLVLALTAFHREAPAIRPRPWLVAYGMGLAVMPFVVWLVQPRTFDLPVWDWPALCAVAVVSTAATYLALTATGRVARTAAWPLGLVLLAAGVLGLRALTLVDYTLVLSGEDRGRLLAYGIGESVALAVVSLPLAVIAIRDLRGLPRGSVPPLP